MSDFTDRKGIKLNKKLITIEGIMINNEGEITTLYVNEENDDDVFVEDEGTKLEADTLNKVVSNLIKREIGNTIVNNDKVLSQDKNDFTLPAKIKKDLLLPNNASYGSKIIWSLESGDAILSDYLLKIEQGELNKTITLKATFVYKGLVDTKLFNVIVEALNVLSYDKNHLALPSETTSNLTLPLQGVNGSNITWSIVSGIGISIEDGIGSISRGEQNKTVRLKATLEYENKTDEKEFDVVIKAYDGIIIDKNNLTLPSEVTTDFPLNTSGTHGSSISWSVYEGTGITVVNNTAIVTRGNTDNYVVLRATLSNNENTETKDFTVKVLKLRFVVLDSNDLSISSEVSSDFTLPSVGSRGSTIIWSVYEGTNISIYNNMAYVIQTSNDEEVTLRATLSYMGDAITRDFYVTVIGFDVIEYDMNNLSIPSTATDDFTLPANGTYGSSISWEVVSGTGISISGSNAYVTSSSTNQYVILRATLTYNNKSDTMDFYVTIPKETDTIDCSLSPSYGELIRSSNLNQYVSIDFDILSNVNEDLYIEVESSDEDLFASSIISNSVSSPSVRFQETSLLKTQFSGSAEFTFTVYVYLESNHSECIDELSGSIFYSAD